MELKSLNNCAVVSLVNDMHRMNKAQGSFQQQQTLLLKSRSTVSSQNGSIANLRKAFNQSAKQPNDIFKQYPGSSGQSSAIIEISPVKVKPQVHCFDLEE